MRGTLGPDILDVSDKTLNTLRTAIRMSMQPGPTYRIRFYMKIPHALASSADRYFVYFSLIHYAAAIGGAATSETTYVTTVFGPKSAGEWVEVAGNVSPTSGPFVDFSIFAVASTLALTAGTDFTFDNVEIYIP